MDKLKEDNIIETVIKLMEQVERMIDKNGEEKKLFVVSGTKLILGNAVYERHSYFISMFIDFAIQVSKGKKLNFNNLKNNYCCF